MVMLILLSVVSGTSIFLVFSVLVLWSLFSWAASPSQQYDLLTLSPKTSGVMLALNTSVLQLAIAAGLDSEALSLTIYRCKPLRGSLLPPLL